MMYNPAGFDPQGLDMNADLGDPRRQEKLPGSYATQGQAVSAPYAEANMKAAEKTNPMNAVSQEPGKAFLDQYKQKAGLEQGETAFLNFFGGKALDKKQMLEDGTLKLEDVQGNSITDRMLRRQLEMQLLEQQMLGQ